MTIARTLLFTVLVMFAATSAFAVGSSAADCDGDGSNDVSCSGHSCEATDGIGCACSDSEGNLSDLQSCQDEVIAGPDWQANVIWTETAPLGTRLSLPEPQASPQHESADQKDADKAA